MKKIYFVLLIITYPLFGQSSNKFELLDIFNLENISNPQISSSGEKIVYSRISRDVMTDKTFSNLWSVNFDGSKNLPLTTGNQNDSNPVWFNDGRRIIYKSNKSGKTQIYLRWLESGAEAKLTNLNNSPGSIVLSPDNSMIAFTMFVTKQNKSGVKLPPKPKGAKWNKPPIYINKLKYRSDGRGYEKSGFRQLFVLSIDGGTPRQLTFDDFHHSTPEWSKNSELIYYSANNKPEAEYEPRDSEIFSLNITDGKVIQLTERHGPDNNPVVSNNGKMIAYLGNDEKYLGYQITQLYIMNSDGTDRRIISKGFDRGIRNLYWNKEDSGLYFQYVDKGMTKIAFINLDGEVEDIVSNVSGLAISRPYTAGTFSISPNGKYAFTYGSTAHPADLAVGQDGKTKRLTKVNDDLFSFKKIGKVEEIWFKSSYDKRDIQGWIVKPPDFDPNKKYPLILEIHGGPFASYGFEFSAEDQVYAAAGYVVLYINPRGSTSYGEEFGNLIHHNYPGQDYDDLISGVDEVIKNGYIDEDNLFVTGGSGGGVLTAWIVGKTNRFAAAVVAKPVINWYSFILNSDNPATFYKYWFGDFPWENSEPYLKRSPLSYVGNVKTPTMLLTGENDYRTPISESEQFYTALKLLKVDAAMVRIPGSSHGIASRPSNLIAKLSAILQWFEEHKN